MNYGELLSSFLIDLQRLFRADICFKDTTYSQILAIISIPADGIEMSELAWVLGLDNSTVTRLIIRLEKKSWVKRKQSQRDQRAVTVFLTNKGSTIQQDIEKKIDIMGLKNRSAGFSKATDNLPPNYLDIVEKVKELVKTNKKS